jgi:hypothetical protein
LHDNGARSGARSGVLSGVQHATLTQRGVLPQGVSEATLWLFETSRIRAQMNRQQSAAVPRNR